MTRPFNRRDVFWTSAVLSILGFLAPAALAQAPELLPPPSLSVQKKEAPPPDARVTLEEALKRMKQDLKPGVVILVPEPQAAQGLLAAQLGRLLSGSIRRQARALDLLFSEAVFTCLPAAQAHKAFPGIAPETVLLVLAPDGKPVSSIADGPALFQDGFLASVAELLHGPGGTRLEATARAQRQALGALAVRVDDAIRDLDSDRFRKREAASAFLAGVADRSTALLIRAYRAAPSLEVQCRIERLLGAVLASTAEQSNNSVLLGARWEETNALQQGLQFAGAGQAGVVPAAFTATPTVLRFDCEKRP